MTPEQQAYYDELIAAGFDEAVATQLVQSMGSPTTGGGTATPPTTQYGPPNASGQIGGLAFPDISTWQIGKAGVFSQNGIPFMVDTAGGMKAYDPKASADRYLNLGRGRLFDTTSGQVTDVGASVDPSAGASAAASRANAITAANTAAANTAESARQFNETFGYNKAVHNQQQNAAEANLSGMLNGRPTLAAQQQQFNQFQTLANLASNPRNFMQNFFQNRGFQPPAGSERYGNMPQGGPSRGGYNLPSFMSGGPSSSQGGPSPAPTASGGPPSGPPMLPGRTGMQTQQPQSLLQNNAANPNYESNLQSIAGQNPALMELLRNAGSGSPTGQLGGPLGSSPTREPVRSLGSSAGLPEQRAGLNLGPANPGMAGPTSVPQNQFGANFDPKAFNASTIPLGPSASDPKFLLPRMTPGNAQFDPDVLSQYRVGELSPKAPPPIPSDPTDMSRFDNQAYGARNEYAKGGIVAEPVMGVGMNSNPELFRALQSSPGHKYLMGEDGPEGVVPASYLPKFLQSRSGEVITGDQDTNAYAQGGMLGTANDQGSPVPMTMPNRQMQSAMRSPLGGSTITAFADGGLIGGDGSSDQNPYGTDPYTRADGGESPYGALSSAGSVPPFLQRAMGQSQGNQAYGTNMPQKSYLPPGLPLQSQLGYNQMSPSEQQAYQSYASSYGIDPNDLLAQIRQQTGAGRSRQNIAYVEQ